MLDKIENFIEEKGSEFVAATITKMLAQALKILAVFLPPICYLLIAATPILVIVGRKKLAMSIFSKAIILLLLVQILPAIADAIAKAMVAT